MPNSNEKGFVLVFPVLVVSAILLLSFTFSSFKSHNNINTSAVLSESSVSGENRDEAKTDSINTDSETPKATQEPLFQSPKPEFFSSTKTVKFNSKEQELKKKLLLNQSPKPTPKISPKPSQTLKPEKTPPIQVESKIENENKGDSGLDNASTPQPVMVKIELKDGVQHFEAEKVNVNLSENNPVKVDDKTGELTITTPNGEKPVTFLPEDAIENILGSNSVSELETNSETGKTELKLTVNSNGVPVYEVEGIKKGRFLGVFNVNIKKTVQISAIDGAEGSVTVSGFDKFLDFLSL